MSGPPAVAMMVFALMLGTGAVFAENPPPDTARRTIDVPLQSLLAANGANLSIEKGRALLTIAAGSQWAYAAGAPLPFSGGTAGRATVRVRLKVEEGQLGLGVVESSNLESAQFLVEEAVDISDAPVDLMLDIPDVAHAGSLVMRSWSPNETATRAQIYSIQIAMK